MVDPTAVQNLLDGAKSDSLHLENWKSYQISMPNFVIFNHNHNQIQCKLNHGRSLSTVN